jgi:YHS domain-containing protein
VKQVEPGKPEFHGRYQGSDWYFASAENLERFRADPKRFAPKFGGFCAFAVSKGFTARSNPEVFHLDDGNLYLFDGEEVRETWLKSLSPDLLAESGMAWHAHIGNEENGEVR